MNNPVLDTIMSRRSIRAYKPQQITEEQLTALTQAAITSPSANNQQPWQFIVIQDKDVLNEMEQSAINHFAEINDTATLERLQSQKHPIIYDAPTLIVITTKSGGDQMDAGIAVQSIALAAKSMGLDSVILGMIYFAFIGEKTNYWMKKFGLPEENTFSIAIAVGYGDEEGKQRELDESKLIFIK